MTDSDRFQEGKLNKLELIVYLIPILGAFPALLRLYRPGGTKAQRSTSRLSVNLTLTWAILYLLFWFGSSSEGGAISFRFLYANGIVTTGYVITCLVLMVRIWQGKSRVLSSTGSLLKK